MDLYEVATPSSTSLQKLKMLQTSMIVLNKKNHTGLINLMTQAGSQAFDMIELSIGKTFIICDGKRKAHGSFCTNKNNLGNL